MPHKGRANDGLFATGEIGYNKRDGISNAGLKHFQEAYAGEQISKEDLGAVRRMRTSLFKDNEAALYAMPN